MMPTDNDKRERVTLAFVEQLLDDAGVDLEDRKGTVVERLELVLRERETLVDRGIQLTAMSREKDAWKNKYDRLRRKVDGALAALRGE